VQERPPQERPPQGLGCIGLPSMLAVFAFLAFATSLGGRGIVIAAVAVVVIYLVIGLAMTIAKKRE
jgi:hypothetical protein